jgi:hypothetical protein
MERALRLLFLLCLHKASTFHRGVPLSSVLPPLPSAPSRPRGMPPPSPSPVGATVAGGIPVSPPSEQSPSPEGTQYQDGFLHWILSWPRESRLPSVRLPILMNMVSSALLAYLHHRGLVPALDGGPHGYVAGPLGFLLALRCGEGNSRCAQAREVR